MTILEKLSLLKDKLVIRLIDCSRNTLAIGYIDINALSKIPVIASGMYYKAYILLADEWVEVENIFPYPFQLLMKGDVITMGPLKLTAA